MSTGRKGDEVAPAAEAEPAGERSSVVWAATEDDIMGTMDVKLEAKQDGDVKGATARKPGMFKR